MSPEVSGAAARLLAQYGEDAAVIALLRAAEHAALGDLETCEPWEAVAALLSDPAAGQGTPN